MIPAILYGGHQEPVSLALPQNEVHRQAKEEGFFSHILTLRIGESTERAILRDLQRHPYKPLIQHLDFQRISEGEAIRVRVPLHFVNEDKCKGVRQEGGVISRLQIEVEVSCMPKDLPEYIEVDVANLGMNESIHLSEIVLPEGIELVQLAHEGADATVVNVHYPHGAGRDEEEGEGEGEDEEDIERDED